MTYEERLKKYNALTHCKDCNTKFFEANEKKTCLKCGGTLSPPVKGHIPYEIQETKPARR